MTLLVAMLALTPLVSAEPVPEASPWGVGVRTCSGTVTAPFYTEALSETSSELLQAALTVVDGFYVLRSPQLVVGARLPLARSLVRLPGGSYADDGAVGNPELYVEDRSLSWATMDVAVRAGVGVPIAQHGSSSLVQNQALALSSAVDGWRNPELFEPGVVPVTLSARAVISPAPWGLSLAAKAPVLIRLNDASLPEEAATQPVGFVPHVEARGTWNPLERLVISAGSAVVLLVPPAVSAPEGSARTGTFHWAGSAGLDRAIGEHMLFSLDFDRALFGPLAGSYGIGLGLGYAR